VKVFTSLSNTLDQLSDEEIVENIFVIGGQQLYSETVNHILCDKIYTTEIPGEYDVDTFFPKLPKYFVVNETVTQLSEKINANIKFITYTNRSDVNSEERQYQNLLSDIINYGELKKGRNGDTLSMFGPQHIFDLNKGFPLLTTKRMFFGGIVKELLFFLRGQTDANILAEQGVRIWNGNTTREFLDSRGLNDYKVGDMGAMYGWNWRHFSAEYTGCDTDYTDRGHDQLKELLHKIVNEPNSRRLLLTTYDPSKVKQAVLPPCHGLITQFNIRKGTYLDCKMFQRSVDTALGYPFNIASYALLVHIMCQITGYRPGKLIMTLGNVHIYKQHIEKIKRQIDRVPIKFPTLQINKNFDTDNKNIDAMVEYIENLQPEDFKLTDYSYHPGILLDMVA